MLYLPSSRIWELLKVEQAGVWLDRSSNAPGLWMVAKLPMNVMPYVVDRMDRYYEVTRYNWRPVPRCRAREYLRDGNVFLAVEGDDRLLTTVAGIMGEDQLVVSADIPHPESRENCMAEIRARTDISDTVKGKILTHNPARLFGIDVAAWGPSLAAAR